MRTVFVDPAYRAETVKPNDLLTEYRERLARDVETDLAPTKTISRICPACGSEEVASGFEKFGMTYSECGACKTVYADNTPTDEAIRAFYKTAGSEIFWQDHLAVETHESRMTHIVEPRAAWVADGIAEYLGHAETLLDIGCQFDGYETAFSNLKQVETVAQLYPSASGMAETEPSPERADVVVLFETLDRTIDVEGLMAKVAGLLPSGGLAFVTGILASGFEFQILREKSESLLPPDRLNLFTIEGWENLFARHGFEVAELSTPGSFDLSLVANSGVDTLPGFVRYLIEHRSDDDHLRFQEFLQSSLLSGMGRALIRKR